MVRSLRLDEANYTTSDKRWPKSSAKSKAVKPTAKATKKSTPKASAKPAAKKPSTSKFPSSMSVPGSSKPSQVKQGPKATKGTDSYKPSSGMGGRIQGTFGNFFGSTKKETPARAVPRRTDSYREMENQSMSRMRRDRLGPGQS